MKVLDIGIGMPHTMYSPEPTILTRSMWDTSKGNNPEFSFLDEKDLYVAVELGESKEQCPGFKHYRYHGEYDDNLNMYSHLSNNDELKRRKQIAKGIVLLGELKQALREQRPKEAIEIMACDARSLPFRGGMFDIVYAGNVLNEDKTTIASLEIIIEARRVLRVGGSLLAKLRGLRTLIRMLGQWKI